ncbi:hypothetical protein PO909_016908 [Leuciscus waleckii]
MLEKLKKTRLQTAYCYTGSGDVECDVCTGRKHKLSSPVCKHKLTDATGRLQEMIFTKHDEQIKIY